MFYYPHLSLYPIVYLLVTSTSTRSFQRHPQVAEPISSPLEEANGFAPSTPIRHVGYSSYKRRVDSCDLEMHKFLGLKSYLNAIQASGLRDRNVCYYNSSPQSLSSQVNMNPFEKAVDASPDNVALFEETTNPFADAVRLSPGHVDTSSDTMHEADMPLPSPGNTGSSSNVVDLANKPLPSPANADSSPDTMDPAYKPLPVIPEGRPRANTGERPKSFDHVLHFDKVTEMKASVRAAGSRLKDAVRRPVSTPNSPMAARSTMTSSPVPGSLVHSQSTAIGTPGSSLVQSGSFSTITTTDSSGMQASSAVVPIRGSEVKGHTAVTSKRVRLVEAPSRRRLAVLTKARGEARKGKEPRARVDPNMPLHRFDLETAKKITENDLAIRENDKRLAEINLASAENDQRRAEIKRETQQLDEEIAMRFAILDTRYMAMENRIAFYETALRAAVAKADEKEEEEKNKGKSV